jgi:hypothetical protein
VPHWHLPAGAGRSEAPHTRLGSAPAKAVFTSGEVAIHFSYLWPLPCRSPLYPEPARSTVHRWSACRSAHRIHQNCGDASMWQIT